MRNIVLILLLISGFSYSQSILNIQELKPDTSYENILVKKISGTEKSTNFVIWIKNEVKTHYHAEHAESVYIVQGTGKMTLGGDTISVKAGDFISIPPGMHHSLIVTSTIPMKVLSVQAPEFKGVDRHFIE